jgi:hypothetical protein
MQKKTCDAETSREFVGVRDCSPAGPKGRKKNKGKKNKENIRQQGTPYERKKRAYEKKSPTKKSGLKCDLSGQAPILEMRSW